MQVQKIVATAEGKRTERFSEKSLHLESSLKSDTGSHSECTLRSPSNSGHVSAPPLLTASPEGDISSVTGVKGVDLPDT